MRMRTIATGLTVAMSFAISGCSGSTAAGSTSPLGELSGKPKVGPSASSTLLPSSVLAGRLLAEADLGQDYTRKPEKAARHDDVTVIGCPALEQLGGDAATGGSLDFPNKAKAAFLYSDNTGSEISEELYSDTAPKLTDGTKRIFDAMTGCPIYQVVVGSKPIKITTQKLAAPALGDQAWSQLLTFTAGGQDSIVKQTAVRTGAILLIVSGSPALVDSHVEKALAKAHPAS
uniref:Secreted protein n=1 Tax=Streptomyces sp. NBC_00049 TaxID=2903617 RepID=A0AAU2K0F3_9ACTN